MSFGIAGFKSKVLSGSTDMDVVGGSFDHETGDIDTTTTSDNGWEDSIDAPQKISGSFDFMYNPNKSPFSDVTKLRPGRSTTDFPTLLLYYSETEYVTGTARIQKLTKKSTVKDGIVFTATFVSKGAWTWGP